MPLPNVPEAPHPTGAAPFSVDEVEELRAATPGAAHAAYFLNAGAALMPAVVDQAVRAH